jgi:hypothetical protein
MKSNSPAAPKADKGIGLLSNSPPNERNKTPRAVSVDPADKLKQMRDKIKDQPGINFPHPARLYCN